VAARREKPVPDSHPRAPEATAGRSLCGRPAGRAVHPGSATLSVYSSDRRRGHQAPPPTGSIRGSLYQCGPLIDLSIWQQVALSIPRLGPLSWSHSKSTSRFDHMASCRQVDMSPSPTVDMSLLLQTSCPLRLAATPRDELGLPGAPRQATTVAGPVMMVPAAAPTHERAAVLGPAVARETRTPLVEVPGARAHAPRGSPEERHHKSQLELYTFTQS
jgi:hypothetical protein